MGGDVRGNLGHGSERCFLISLAARFLKSEVLHERERSTRN